MCAPPPRIWDDYQLPSTITVGNAVVCDEGDCSGTFTFTCVNGSLVANGSLDTRCACTWPCEGDQ